MNRPQACNVVQFFFLLHKPSISASFPVDEDESFSRLGTFHGAQVESVEKKGEKGKNGE